MAFIWPMRDALASDVGRPITTLEHHLEDWKLGRNRDTHERDSTNTPRCHTAVDILEPVWLKRDGRLHYMHPEAV